jgi:hypothetical protein
MPISKMAAALRVESVWWDSKLGDTVFFLFVGSDYLSSQMIKNSLSPCGRGLG